MVIAGRCLQLLLQTALLRTSMNALSTLLLLALLVIQQHTAYSQLAGGRPGLRQQIVRQQQKRGRQEEQRRSDQAAQLQQRMVQRVSRADPKNTNLPGTTVTAPADGPYLPSDDVAAAGQYVPSVFNGVIGPYSSRSSRAPGGPEFAFGWAPVVLDGSPEEEYDEAWQQPKVWNYRCYKACGRCDLRLAVYQSSNLMARQLLELMVELIRLSAAATTRLYSCYGER